MNIVKEVSIFRVLKTTSEDLIGINKSGYLNDSTLGIYHMIGYEPNTYDLLVIKPREGEEPFLVLKEYYQQHCEELLNFKLFNN